MLLSVDCFSSSFDPPFPVDVLLRSNDLIPMIKSVLLVVTPMGFRSGVLTDFKAMFLFTPAR